MAHDPKLEELAQGEYEYGWETEIEMEYAPKGLTPKGKASTSTGPSLRTVITPGSEAASSAYASATARWKSACSRSRRSTTS